MTLDQSPIPTILLIALLVTTAFAGCTTPDGSTVSADETQETTVALEPFVTGLDRPVQLVLDPRDADRFLVAEMGGTIRPLHLNGTLGDPILDLGPRLGTNHREQGLLGLAPHPEPDDPRLFVTYVPQDDAVVLASFVVGPDGGIDPASEEVLLRVPQPKPYHNGGHIAFGPDGYLYAAFGDGGPQGDPQRNAQDLDTLLGTLIRIDVDPEENATWSAPGDNPFVGKEGRDEIWLYGLRNPWRFSFDLETGDLWVADVGFLAMEEVNRIPASLGGGHNLGWPDWEGTDAFRPQVLIEVPVLFPVHAYPREEPCSSVTGGSVYHGDELEDLHGVYLFADFCTGGIRALERTETAWAARDLLSTGLPIAAFGEGPDGSVYILSYEGSIHRLGPAS